MIKLIYAALYYLNKCEMYLVWEYRNKIENGFITLFDSLFQPEMSYK